MSLWREARFTRILQRLCLCGECGVGGRDKLFRGKVNNLEEHRAKVRGSVKQSVGVLHCKASGGVGEGMTSYGPQLKSRRLSSLKLSTVPKI